MGTSTWPGDGHPVRTAALPRCPWASRCQTATAVLLPRLSKSTRVSRKVIWTCLGVWRLREDIKQLGHPSRLPSAVFMSCNAATDSVRTRILKTDSRCRSNTYHCCKSQQAQKHFASSIVSSFISTAVSAEALSNLQRQARHNRAAIDIRPAWHPASP